MSQVSVFYCGGGDGFLSISVSHTSPRLENEPKRCVCECV